MRISLVAVERIAAKDPLAAQSPRRAGPMMSDGRSASDDALVERFRSLGIPISRDRLDELAWRHPSAEELAGAFQEELQGRITGTDEDWIWIALACLWERWLPDRMNLEMV